MQFDDEYIITYYLLDIIRQINLMAAGETEPNQYRLITQYITYLMFSVSLHEFY